MLLFLKTKLKCFNYHQHKKKKKKKDDCCKDITHIFSYMPRRSHCLCKLLKFNQNQPIHENWHFISLLSASYWFLAWITLQPWRWWQHAPLKCQTTFNTPHGITSQKTELFITAVVWTSNPTYQVPCSLNWESVKLEKSCRPENTKNWAQHALQCGIFYFLLACNFQRQMYFTYFHCHIICYNLWGNSTNSKIFIL
jgi:hypothetical protein